MGTKQKILLIIGILLMIAAPIILIIWGESIDRAAISVLVSVYGTAVALISFLWNMNKTIGENNYMLKDNRETLKRGIEILDEIRSILESQ